MTTNGAALAGNTFTMPSENVTVAAAFEETLIATYDITITAPQNGTLETSVTNNVAAGTVVTVTATPAAGYELVSVTTNDVAIVGTTFAMPAGDVTLAATFAENTEPTHMFYIGDTGYDSWMDVYAAAKAGDTIVVGVNAEIRQSSGTISKSITIDLCGRSLNHASGWLTGCSIDVVDTGATPGQFVVSAYSMNVSGGTLDLSSLASDQVTGRFQMSGTTLLAFPGDRPFADCTSAITTKAEGARIVVQGGTYTWDGTNWVPEGHDITIAAPQNGTLETSATNNVSAGTVVTVFATPAAGYELVSVTTNGAAIAGNSFTMPSEAVTLAAVFEETLIASYDITITAPQNGTLETSATNDVAAGTVVTVTATPAAGYELASVTTNGAPLAGTTFEMPAEDVTVAATFAEKAVPTHMFYIGETGYGSWTNAFKAAKAGDTIVVGANAVIDHPHAAGTINKSVTIDLCGRPLDFAQGWVTECTVKIVDTGTPAGSGQFELLSSGMNISGATLDLSALSGSQVSGAGKLQISATSLVKFPHDLSLTDSTPFIRFDGADPTHGVGARILVKGILYIYDGEKWVPYAAIRITSIAVGPDTVKIGVSVELQDGFTGTVTIRGCETLDGTYHDRKDATTDENGLYCLPVSDDRFFQAALVVQEDQD